MTEEKFEGEITTLKKFFTKYCEDKHEEQKEHSYKLTYKEKTLEFKISLCSECNTLLNYSFQRLQQCPHDEKPRCRNCPDPCYDKERWKQLGKLMKYSGMQLGFTKLKKLFRLS